MPGLPWKDLLTRYLAGPGGRPKREALAREVARLSVRFTHPHERARLPRAYLDAPLTRAAYAAYFGPANAAKIACILRELETYAPDALRRPELRVLDLGCGTGAAGLGLAEVLANRPSPPRVTYTGVDASAAAGDDARWLLREAAPAWTVETTRGGLAAPSPAPPADLVFLVDVLNEAFPPGGDPGEAARFLRSCLDRASPGGWLIVVEPALRTLTRRLHAVRDALCAAAGARVAAPCLHERPCPALARDDAWCHEERAWDRPGTLGDVDRRIAHDKRRLKFAYLVLTREGRTLADASAAWAAQTCPGAPLWRAITRRHDLKGKTRLAGCNADGWCDLECLSRDRSDATAPFFKLERGDVFAVRGAAPAGGKLRLAADAPVVHSNPCRNHGKTA